MEIVETEGIKVPNSLIVSGLSYTPVDEEIFDHLKQYGLIRRIVKVDSPESEFHKQAIIEFESGESIQTLKAILPLDRPSSADPNIIHHVKTLASVYSSKAGTEITHTFLSELKGIAKLSGNSFEDILRAELTRITETMGEQTPAEEAEGEHAPTSVQPPSEKLVTSSPTSRTLLNLQSGELNPVETQSHTERNIAAQASSDVGESMNNFHLSPDHLSTPEVQRVVVEHIVKSTEIASQFHSPVKLRPFSGRVPCPNYEVDYDTWRTNVDFYLNDPTVSHSQLVRKIVDSLLPPAANVVKPLGSQTTPHAYLDLLDSAYATVEDGDELFAKFLNTHQNSGEKPSSYLHRLQSSLNVVVRKKAVCASDADKQLLKQFCRGCWNNTLIATLQLEQRQNNPPTFSELLLLLRTEEDKQAAKASRMKQHLGFTKAKVQANTQAVCGNEINDYDLQTQDNTIPSAMEQIKKQIANLQAQIAALTVSPGEKPVKPKTQKTQKPKPKENQHIPQKLSPSQSTPSRPRPWYCFKCGEDGHIVTSCSNPPNPTLVDAKRKELKEKQQAWDKKNASGDTPTLN
ncbi:paraneoplastic antigen Ma3 homolog [Seriola aureovittata]|uniref:paraneoplastic antigen Ma3 homolog n=1 Tax=Seriola aureovittata TaxID=2871759 RepID=UPI0024BD8EDF|nr:paraneoplastic antigen Ma3 homolog [Seriola aureovittata]